MYHSVVYHELYRNINLHYFSDKEKVKYQFEVSAGGNINDIRIKITGIERIIIDDSGNLILYTPEIQLLDEKPYIYQIINSNIVEVKGNYRLIDDQTYGFDGKILGINPLKAQKRKHSNNH